MSGAACRLHRLRRSTLQFGAGDCDTNLSLTMFCMTLMFLRTGLGLDPRQEAISGAAAAAILIGVASGISSFATDADKPGCSASAS